MSSKYDDNCIGRSVADVSYDAEPWAVSARCIHGNPVDDCFTCKIDNVPWDIELLRCDVCGEPRVYKGHCYVCDKDIA